MPAKTSVPLLPPPAPRPDDELAEGFFYFTHRWIDAAAEVKALRLRDFLRSHGHRAGVFQSETSEWRQGAHQKFNYYKVFITHPTREGYYAWFAPGNKDEFFAPIQADTLTWFEYEASTK